MSDSYYDGDGRFVFLVGKGMTKMASGRLEVSLSLADKASWVVSYY